LRRIERFIAAYRSVNLRDKKLVFLITSNNHHIHDEHGTLLNPDGWPFEKPDRILTQEETSAWIDAGMGAATWGEYLPELDGIAGGILYHCYAMYTYPALNGGKSFRFFTWVSTATGTFHGEDNPIFDEP